MTYNDELLRRARRYQATAITDDHERQVRRVSTEKCKCDHLMVKHIHVNLGGDGREYGNCSLCPCRLFRRVAA